MALGKGVMEVVAALRSGVFVTRGASGENAFDAFNKSAQAGESIFVAADSGQIDAALYLEQQYNRAVEGSYAARVV